MRIQRVISPGSAGSLHAPAQVGADAGGGGISGADGPKGARAAPSQIDLIESYFDENAETWSDVQQQYRVRFSSAPELRSYFNMLLREQRAKLKK